MHLTQSEPRIAPETFQDSKSEPYYNRKPETRSEPRIAPETFQDSKSEPYYNRKPETRYDLDCRFQVPPYY